MIITKKLKLVAMGMGHDGQLTITLVNPSTSVRTDPTMPPVLPTMPVQLAVADFEGCTIGQEYVFELKPAHLTSVK